MTEEGAGAEEEVERPRSLFEALMVAVGAFVDMMLVVATAVVVLAAGSYNN